VSKQHAEQLRCLKESYDAGCPDQRIDAIIEVATGKSFSTLVAPTTVDEFQSLGIDWQFDWIAEFNRGEVFKLIVPKLGRQIHGLISLSPREDHIWINVVENHPENIGRRKSTLVWPRIW
jgi:hypothetical protein